MPDAAPRRPPCLQPPPPCPADAVSEPHRLQFSRRPSAAAYLLRVARQPVPAGGAVRVPPIESRWDGVRASPRALAQFRALTGLAGGERLPLLYVHVLGFRLQMTVLTHPAFPLPIRRGLQIRNHLLQRAVIPAGAELHLEARVADQRILAKGAEVDLHLAVHADGEPAYEGLTTFYYRGRFGEPGAESPMARPPTVPETGETAWRMPSQGRWRFGRQTGDYNPLHFFSGYARKAGFPGATLHPQRVLGQCLARLPEPHPAAPQRLDAWLRGPVPYGAEVRLRADSAAQGTDFALFAEGDPRPAILGRWSAPAAPALLDAHGRPLHAESAPGAASAAGSPAAG